MPRNKPKRSPFDMRLLLISSGLSIVATVLGSIAVINGAFTNTIEHDFFPASKGFVREVHRKPNLTQIDTQIELAEGKREGAQTAIALLKIEEAKAAKQGDVVTLLVVTTNIRIQETTIKKLNEQIETLMKQRKEIL